MRIAVVSDIHGNLPALMAVVADFQRRGVDQVVNLGDSLSGPLLPKETAHYLMAQDWVHLAGNHERQILNLNANSGASDRYAHSQLSNTEFAWMVSLPSPDARYAIVEKHNSSWTASLISVPHAFKEMAQLARLRNRPDWEHALLTGYMPCPQTP